MNRYRLAKLLIITAALNFNGCGGAASTASNKTAAAPSTADTATPTPTAGTTATPAAPSTADTAAQPPGTVPASEVRNASTAPPAKAPTPQIGSGGSDLFLFTQARAAVNADPDLKAANLTVEVKDGVVILNGTVATAALKARAEELARGVKPKDVRNRLRVSAGK